MAINSRLFMEIGFVNTTLQAIDKTPYERWINDGYLDNGHEHMVLQRVLKIVDGETPRVIDSVSIKVTNEIEVLRDPFEKENLANGLYYYQKMLIPASDHITTANERLYFDSNNKVHWVDSDSGINVILDPSSDFDEIYDILRDKYPDNCFYFDDYSFTIYDLVRCYVLTERDRINNYLKNNCKGACVVNNDLQQRADILLAAIMVINNLLERGDFFEAQRILNGLNTCGHLCKDYVDKGLNSCGCGRA